MICLGLAILSMRTSEKSINYQSRHIGTKQVSDSEGGGCQPTPTPLAHLWNRLDGGGKCSGIFSHILTLIFKTVN